MKNLQARITKILRSLSNRRAPYGYLNPRAGYKKIIPPFLIGLILLTFGYVLTVRSMPGTTLYELKVSGTEELGKYFQIGDHAKASYRLALLDRRLSEIERISTREKKLSDEARTSLETQIVESFEEFNLIIETNDSVSPRELIDLLYQLTTTLYLHDRIMSRTDELDALADAAEERSNTADDFYKGTVHLFVASASEEEIQSYINGKLQLLLRQIDTKDTDTETRLKVNRRLQEIQQAVADNDAAEAVLKVHEALQLLHVAKYFE